MTVHIVQISDSHLSAEFPQRERDMALCIEHINALPQLPDLVVHTGDVAHDGKPEEYRAAKTQLDRLNAPYRVLVGNRDKRQPLLDTFAGNELPVDVPFIQYCVDHLPVRLIVLDTLSVATNKGELCPERLDSFKAMLLRDSNRPTAIFMHHTPFEATEIPDPQQFEPWSVTETFNDIVAGFENIIGIYCGHVHRNIESSVGEIHASALTCMAGDLRKGAVTDAERKLPVFRSIMLG